MFFRKYKALKKENEELKNKIKELEEKNSPFSKPFIIKEDRRKVMECNAIIKVPYWENDKLRRIYGLQPEEIMERHLQELRRKMIENIACGINEVMTVRESPYVNPLEQTSTLEGTVYFLSKE